MQKKLLLSSPLLDLCIQRICQELIENHQNFDETVILGLQPRGSFFAQRIHAVLEESLSKKIPLGYLDATFYRDDFKRRNPISPNATQIPFLIEQKNVILIDDVIATGRMVRAALDAMTAFGRPHKVELCVLINRIYNRELPIYPDYFGKKVNTLPAEKVLVEWKEQGADFDAVWFVEN